MTQEEKAKAYDIALDKIKRLLGTGSNCSREDLEHVFPELKDSEDERIRTKLLNLLKELLELGGVAQDTWSINDCEEFIAYLEKQGEQDSSWSEEDIMRIDNLIAIIENRGYPDYVDYLKKLKNRILPQPKQEWSEEDEYHKRQILRILKDNGCSQTLQERTEKWIEERLKSLRPQNTWKPSDEQMTYIQDAISKYNEFSNEYIGLVKLYNDLKKLKGE